MLIHGRIGNSGVNGPGNRVVIHFQGCDLGCEGCWNPGTHAFQSDKHTTFEEIKAWILDQKGVDGITFSGGEPMQQAQYLYLIIRMIKEERPKWSLLMFTGYAIKELERGAFKWYKESDGEWQQGSAKLWNEIKQHLDLVVAGRYNKEKRTSDLPLRGSTNQELVFLTDRYKESDIAEQAVEMNISADGQLIKITGFPIGFDDILNLDAPEKPVVAKSSVIEDLEDPDGGMLVGV